MLEIIRLSINKISGFFLNKKTYKYFISILAYLLYIISYILLLATYYCILLSILFNIIFSQYCCCCNHVNFHIVGLVKTFHSILTRKTIKLSICAYLCFFCFISLNVGLMHASILYLCCHLCSPSKTIVFLFCFF